MATKIHRGTIDDKLNVIFDDVISWKKNKFILKGKEIEIVLRKKVKHRSTNQNAYMHGVVFKSISYLTGYEVYEVKEIMKSMFLSVEKDGFRFAKPTSILSTDEMEEFLRQCRMFAWNQWKLPIPPPNEFEVEF